jgi:hypothetical protein
LRAAGRHRHDLDMGTIFTRTPRGTDDRPPPGAASYLLSRSCCCPAKPAVLAVMPPVPARPHETDLLLCEHHFRFSRQALAAVGASVRRLRG